MNSSRLEKMNNNKQPQQEDSKVRVSQHHKNVQNATWHIYPSEVGANIASKTRASLMRIQNNNATAKHQSPVVQFDFCYFKSLGEQKKHLLVVSNKTQDFNFHVQCIQSFLMECGRGTCSTQQHCTTIRSRGTSYITTKRNSSKAWKQHYSSTFTSILIAITRNCWKISQNIDGAS